MISCVDGCVGDGGKYYWGVTVFVVVVCDHGGKG